MPKSTAIFRLDDSETPGLARVELLKERPSIGNCRIWRVRVLDIVKPSAIRRCKVGQTLDVADALLEFKASEI